MVYLRTLIAGTALALGAIPPAHAADYSAMYVFGDSLSDRGNFAEAVGNPFPNPPSFHYSFTNGPVAVQLVAQSFGLAADPSLWLNNFNDDNSLFPTGYVPGTSYAVGGATAQAKALNGIEDINLPYQIDAYLGRAGNAADAGALYTMLIGGNDIRDATLAGGGGADAIAAGVNAELAALNTLISAGAKQLLVINVPDVGTLPQFRMENPTLAAVATQNTLLYNQLLTDGLAGLSLGPDVSLVTFDLFSYNRRILANSDRLGFTNTIDPCYTDAPLATTTTPECGPGADNIGQFTYWNNVHPTREVHALWARGIEAALDGRGTISPVPEPASWALIIAGFGLIGVAARRRLASAAPVVS